MLELMLKTLAEVDLWLDDCVSQEYKDQPLAQDWARVSKVVEEAGEAINELILLTGQNPRKQRTDSVHDLLYELADTAITAILAIQHFTKDRAQTGGILADKTRMIGARMVQHRARSVMPNRDAPQNTEEWSNYLNWKLNRQS